MRRIMLLLAVVALMVLMSAMSVAPALAKGPPQGPAPCLEFNRLGIGGTPLKGKDLAQQCIGFAPGL